MIKITVKEFMKLLKKLSKGDIMESINDINNRSSLMDNKLIGNPNLINSTITFTGKNNILFCEDNINIVNTSIQFHGDNSVVYLCFTKSNYVLDIHIFQNSLIYMGRDNKMSPVTHINVQEHQNLIIGDDCIIGSNCNIRTSDAHIVYDSNSKKRVNNSSSVFIGDHVWLAHQIYIEMGVRIGSGAILNNNSHIYKYSILKSNNLYAGNPARIVQKDVFFTKDYTGNFTEENTLNVQDYNSRVFIFSEKPGETLDFKKINQMISSFSPEEKIDFIQKLFIQNKTHDRFSL